MKNLTAVVLLLVTAFAPLAGADDDEGEAGPASSWSKVLADFQEGYFAYQPAFAVAQGRHEFDGKLPDWSAAGIADRMQWLQEQARRAKHFKAAKLTAAQEFEREYMLARIDHDLFWLEDARAPFTNPAVYIDDLEPSVYLTRPYAPIDVRLKAYVAYLKAIPVATTQIRANLKVPMARTLLERGVAAFDGFAEFYRGDALKAFAEVKDPALQAQLREATEPAARAMQKLADWLKGERPTANDNYALGAKTFAAMLWRTERVRTPISELEKVGKADLARNQAALKQACAQYLPDASLQACIDKTSLDKPSGGSVEGARAQLGELREFIVEHKLLSIPGTELARVDEAPPYQRANFAYINIPGPFDKGMPSTYYISPPDPTWSKAEQDAYVPGKADLLFTSVHEVWPGHFLQFLHANRSPFQFGQIFVGYAFAEGWAHYAEEMMWEAGLGKGAPEIHIGQLSNALLRNVRFLCAIGLHTQGMSVQACEKMFREQAYQDAGNSRQQAARGTYDPAYLNYTMGKLMIRKLREDWTVSRGAAHGCASAASAGCAGAAGRKAWAEFHDKFLSFGGPPIPLVREQMLGSKKGELF